MSPTGCGESIPARFLQSHPAPRCILHIFGPLLQTHDAPFPDGRRFVDCSLPLPDGLFQLWRGDLGSTDYSRSHSGALSFPPHTACRSDTSSSPLKCCGDRVDWSRSRRLPHPGLEKPVLLRHKGFSIYCRSRIGYVRLQWYRPKQRWPPGSPPSPDSAPAAGIPPAGEVESGF